VVPSPTVKAALGCTEYDYEKIVQKADRMMRRHMSGIRGQMITVYDNFDYWVVVATREYFRE
jgi:hypothetical protein